MIRLSFVVPFYNVERYIEQCIRSLYSQDIPQEEYEVICIDDCSTDASRIIVNKLQKEYSTLKLLETPENLRQGGARNIGLNAAKGKYVWFVDSDDYIIPNCIGGMLDKAEIGNLDVLRIYPVSEGELRTDMIEYGPRSGSEFVFDAPMSEEPDKRCCSVCIGLISRKLLVDNNIFFVEKVQYEDDDFAYQFYAKAKRVHLIPLSAYVVRCVAESTTRNVRKLKNVYDVLYEAQRIALLKGVLCKFDNRWANLIANSVRWTFKGQVLIWLKSIPEEEQRLFYKTRFANLKYVLWYLGINEILAVLSFFYWHKIYCR